MDTDTLTPTVAANAKKRMQAAEESLSSMERATGISRSRLRVRLGGNSPWSTAEIALVASHFGITPAELCAAEAA